MIVYRDHAPGSKPTDKKYTYRAQAKITPTVLDALKKMAIPPAYTRVKINLSPTAKIIYEGYDDKGRLQQKYSTTHTRNAAKAKFCRLLAFGTVLPKIQSDIRRTIKTTRMSKTKLIAIILQIIWMCGFRVGNIKYQQMYESHGISNIFVKHLQMKDGNINVEFIGKKGVVNKCVITDSDVVNNIVELCKGKGPQDYVFQDNSGELVKPTEINAWLAQYGSITSKDLRTFDVNVMFIDFMKAVDFSNVTSTAKRKKVAKLALEHISSHINNTPAICKKSYLMPEIYLLFVEHPRKYARLFLNKVSSRVEFQSFLRVHCS